MIKNFYHLSIENRPALPNAILVNPEQHQQPLTPIKIIGINQIKINIIII